MHYDFTHLKEFRYWVQKVLPLTYDDSLSYLEVLSKVTEYLNTTIEELNRMGDAVEYLNDLGEGWDARLEAMETRLAAMNAEIEAQNANITTKFSEIDAKFDAQDARIDDAISQLTALIQNEIEDAKRELTAIINEQLAAFAELLENNNKTLKQWVEDTLEEFKQSIPSFEDVIVVDPTTGELTDLQTALNHIYSGGKISYGALSCFEWIEVGLTWDEFENHMFYSLPQGLTCDELMRVARKHIYNVFKAAHAAYDMATGAFSNVVSQISRLAMYTANAGSLTFAEFDAMDNTVDTLVSYGKTCYDYAWNSNSFIEGV